MKTTIRTSTGVEAVVHSHELGVQIMKDLCELNGWEREWNSSCDCVMYNDWHPIGVLVTEEETR